MEAVRIELFIRIAQCELQDAQRRPTGRWREVGRKYGALVFDAGDNPIAECCYARRNDRERFCAQFPDVEVVVIPEPVFDRLLCAS